MAREKRDMKEMFDDFQVLQARVRSLGAVVYVAHNKDVCVTDEDLMNWVDDVNSVINKLNSVKEDVVRFFQD